MAVVAFEAVVHDVATEGASVDMKAMGFRHYVGDHGPKDFNQIHLLPEREWDKYDRAPRDVHGSCSQAGHGKRDE